MAKEILVIDDCDDMRKLLSTRLKSLGFLVDEACDGLACLSFIRAKHYDLLLMDIQMPVLDGLDATRLIRTAESNSIFVTKIIGMSSLPMQTESEEAGMDAFHLKQQLLENLHDILRACLAGEVPQSTGHDYILNTEANPI